MQKNRTTVLIFTALISMIVVFSLGLNVLFLEEIKSLKSEIQKLNADKPSTSSPVLKEFLASRDIFNEHTDSLIREPDSMWTELWVFLSLEQLHYMQEILEGRVALDDPGLINDVTNREKSKPN